MTQASQPYHHFASEMSSISTIDQEDRELQQAIQASLEARSYNMETQFGDSAIGAVAEKEPPCHQRISIEDRIKDLALRAAIELPVVREPHANTWVFIDPPQKQPEQDRHDYERYIKRYGEPIPMRKETLVKYSPVLAKAFGPTAQHRTIRSRNLVRKLRESSSIKYVIDLTPPIEGDEAVYLMTELCCSEGVRLWYQASEIWKVSKMLVGGEEEYTSIKSGKLVSKLRTQCQDAVSRLTGLKSAHSPNSAHACRVGATSPIPIPVTAGHEDTTSHHLASSPSLATTPITLEYTPVRHRSAIERVLAALQGADPKLDSAPKVWTTLAVAKNLEIKHSELNSYIIRWLRAYPNSYFLEVLPEISLQIADGLENYELARDAFAILVGEEALNNLCRSRNPSISNRRSAYGRKREDLPEAIFTRVEYASKSFLERITNDFTDFAGNEMRWIENLPEFQRLLPHTQPNIQDAIKGLKTLLKDYVRGAIHKLLCVNYNSMPAPDLHHPGGHELLPRLSRSDVWIDLTINERILSRTFWHALISLRMFNGASNLDIKEGWDLKWDSIRLSSVEKREMDRGTYREVRTSQLDQLIRTVDYWLSYSEPSIYSPLPIRHKSGSHIAFAEQIEASSAAMQQMDPSYGAQILCTPPDPSQLPEASTDDRNHRRIFHNVPPDNRRIARAGGINWPFASQRREPPSDILDEMEDHATPSPLKLDSADNKYLTDQIASQSPGPQGFSSWTGQDNSNEVGEFDQRESEPERPSIPPFSKQDLEGPRSTNQRDIDQLLSPQPFKETRTSKSLFFDLDEFFLQAHRYIEGFAKQKLQHADQYIRDEPHEIGITNTLVCLQDSEWKYLPLWAGGNDDGSGGVYIDQPPTADLGFSSPGPDVHTGTPTSSIKTPSESDFEMVSGQATETSTNTSMANNRSFGLYDHGHLNRVYAFESVGTSSHRSGPFDDDFTMGFGDEENLARKQTEDQERIEAAEEKTAKEALRIGKGKDRMIDENYADLFDDMDDDAVEEDEGEDTDHANDGDFEEDEDGDAVLV